MHSNLVGLSTIEAKKRLTQHGKNVLPTQDKKTFITTLINVLLEPMFLLLIIADLIYLILGSVEDALILLGFLAISIGVTFFQQRKSEKAIAALKALSAPKATVIRDGTSQKIPSSEVVVGDVLILEEGDRIVADGRLTDTHDLSIDESLLTGESVSVDKKNADAIYSGCMIVRGSGIATVDSIGINTELGKIGKSLSIISDVESPLQRDIKTLIKRFAIGGAILSSIVCLIYGLVHQDWLKGALAAITLTMSLLPQEFTVILTVFMAIGAWRISRQHALTRYAPVIETIGNVNVLCVDKTGTLTENKMSLQALAINGEILDLANLHDGITQPFKELLSHAVLASEIAPFDPMEKAFHESLIKHHPEHTAIHQDKTLVYEYPLSPELPAMTHVWQHNTNTEDHLAVIKGSPEAVIKLCGLSKNASAEIQQQIKIMASQGLRILGVAKAHYLKRENNWPKHPSDFSFEWLGLTGLKDPLRPEVAYAVNQCKQAGIRVVMMTGDHELTAKAIARQAGIATDAILSGQQIQDLSDEALADSIKSTSVFVRIKPEQKLRLVNAFQANNQIVAMTGDGINDAPAIKAANVGISMGARGTDVAREASSIVLLNDDFSSIVNTIRQGRQIYDNLRKAIIYIISVHVPIAGAVFIPLVLGAPPMLMPIHILFLEMIIDPTCAIVFEMEAPDEDLMTRPPRDVHEKIFNLNSTGMAFIQGAGLMVIVVGIYLYSLQRYSNELASTLSFYSLVLGNLLLIIVSRSKSSHFLSLLKRPNPAQWWVIGLTFTLLLLIVKIPFLRQEFRFAEIDLRNLVLIALFSLIGLTWYELIKWTFKRPLPIKLGHLL